MPNTLDPHHSMYNRERLDDDLLLIRYQEMCQQEQWLNEFHANTKLAVAMLKQEIENRMKKDVPK